MTTLEFPFGTLAFRERGTGPPLLLVMGTGADHTSWARQIPALARDFRVIAPDNRGSGRSVPAPSLGATTASFAAEALALLDALGVGSFHVAGYSFGAAIAMELMMLAPERTLAASLHAGWAGPNPATTSALTLSLEVAHRGPEAFLEAACRRNMSPAFRENSAFPRFLQNVLESATLPTLVQATSAATLAG